MAQFARPIADTNNDGGWTTTPLWSKIDEGAPGDGTVITSPTAANLYFTVKLGTVADPSVSTGHVLRVLGGKINVSGPTQSVVAELRQGYVDETTQGTLIATLTGTNQEGSMVLDTYTLSGTEADSITDYSDLFLRTFCRGADIDYIELEVPDATALTGTIAVTEAGDVSALSGTVSEPPTTGSISATETNDTMSASGTIPLPYDHNSYFVPPSAVTGMTSGDHTAIDEWPWTSDDCYAQHTSLGTSTVTFTFDMSAAPGDKKGFWVWYKAHVEPTQTVGYDITELRLTDGTTTLWTDSAPGINIPQDQDAFNVSKIGAFRIPDSAFSGDPNISGLVLEMDVANLDSANGRLHFTGMRMMKSPFTSAQESSLPSSLSGADRVDHDVAGLTLLGIEDAAAVVVIPDRSGNGRHAIRIAGTSAVYNAAGEYISHPSSGGTRFVWVWGGRVTGNHAWFSHIYPEDTGADVAFVSAADEFAGEVYTPTDPNDKNLLGYGTEGAGVKHILMSGIGDGPSHKYGATTITFGAWEWVTEWIQDAGNEKLWLNDDVTADIDAASGSNNLYAGSIGDRESDDRRFQGRWKRHIVVDVPSATYAEADIDNARDELVNGPATGPTGTIAITEANDTSAISGTSTPPPVSGTLAETEEADSPSLSGNLVYSGSLVETEGDDVAALSGNLQYSGTNAETEEDDSPAFSGILVYTGAMSETEEADASSISGTNTPPSSTGSLAETENDDTAAITGTYTPQAITGTIAETEDNDSPSLSGTLAYSGAIAETEEDDSSNLAGVLRYSGTLAGTEEDDDGNFSGSPVFSGTITETEENDTSAISGTYTAAPAALTYMDFLTHSGQAQLADDPAFDLTGDAEWRWDIAPDNWNQATGQPIFGRMGTAPNNNWRIALTNVGWVQFWLEDGAGSFRLVSDLSHIEPTNGTRVQFRIKLTADDGAGNTVVTLETRQGSNIVDLEDDSNWTLSDTNSHVGVQTWKALTEEIRMGGAIADLPNGFLGKFYRAIHWSDLTKATKVFDVEFIDANQDGGTNNWDDTARTNDWTMVGIEHTDWEYVPLDIVGTSSPVEGDDASAFSGVLQYSGSIDSSEEADTATQSGSLGYSGSIVETEEDDDAQISGSPVFLGTISEVEESDSGSLAGNLRYVGSLAESEEGDAAALSGASGLGVNGSISITETNDDLSAAGVLAYGGSVAETEGDDASSIEGTIGQVGSMAETEENDGSSITGTLVYPGSLSETETDDSDSFSGMSTPPPVSGSLVETEEDDDGLLVGGGLFTGSAHTTEGDDDPAFEGTNTPPAIAGSISTTEGADILTIAGVLSYVGSLAETEEDDEGASEGSLLFTGGIATVETGDSSTISGSLNSGASFSAVEEADLFTAQGFLSYAGSLLAVEDNDDPAITGNLSSSGATNTVEESDEGSFSGGIFFTGSMSATEEDDDSSMIGVALNEGFLAPPVEEDDEGAISGAFSTVGAIGVIEEDDDSAISSWVPIFGTLVIVEVNDSPSFSSTYAPKFYPKIRGKGGVRSLSGQGRTGAQTGTGEFGVLRGVGKVGQA